MECVTLRGSIKANFTKSHDLIYQEYPKEEWYLVSGVGNKKIKWRSTYLVGNMLLFLMFLNANLSIYKKKHQNQHMPSIISALSTSAEFLSNIQGQNICQSWGDLSIPISQYLSTGKCVSPVFGSSAIIVPVFFTVLEWKWFNCCLVSQQGSITFVLYFLFSFSHLQG